MTVKRFEVVDTKPDDSLRDQILNIWSAKTRTIISLEFDNTKATRKQVIELDRTLGFMGLQAVTVTKTEEPRLVVQTVRRRVTPRRGSPWS